MIDVRPIVSFDEGSVNVPTNNSDQMIVMNSLDINSMSSNASTTQSGWVFLKKNIYKFNWIFEQKSSKNLTIFFHLIFPFINLKTNLECKFYMQCILCDCRL